MKKNYLDKGDAARVVKRPEGPSEMRCNRCGKLLARFSGGSVEIKCNGCRSMMIAK